MMLVRMTLRMHWRLLPEAYKSQYYSNETDHGARQLSAALPLL